MSSGTRSLWRKDVIGWSLYDFANTIYSMNIVSLYLKRYIVEDLGKDDRFFDIPYSLSMAAAVIFLPALSALSDQATKKKLFLFLFTLTCCVAVGLMEFVPPSLFLVLVFLFVMANFSYEAGQPFYNALLYSVADGARARFISGVGVGLGYVGSIVGMVLVLPFVTGSLYGWDIPFLGAGGKDAAFLPTAVLFMLFALPVFGWVKEKEVAHPEKLNLRKAYASVWEGLTETKKYPGVLRFLVADYFFEDAVATVIINIGLYCSLVLELPEQAITTFLIISTVSAVVGSFLIGKIAQVNSLKRILQFIVWGWILVLVTFVFTRDEALIWVLGSLVGILLGGLWTVTRPMLAELVPRGELGRFFGLFSLTGRAAAIVGPLMWTAIVCAFQPQRALGKWALSVLPGERFEAVKLPYQAAVLSLALMMLVGLYILRKVPEVREYRHG